MSSGLVAAQLTSLATIDCEAVLSGPSFPRTYHVMPRLFDGGLKGIETELPHLAEMGVSAIWLGPVHEQTIEVHSYEADGTMQTTPNDHGYWVSDHSTVDQNLGGEAALRSLIRSADELGLKVFLDIPLNHLGYGEVLRFLGEDVTPRTRPDLFLQTRELEGADYEGFEKLEGRTELLTRQEEMSKLRLMGLNDLNHSNAIVRKYLLDSYKKFVDMGVSGFRMDAVKHLPVDFVTWFVNELHIYTGKQDREFLFLLEFLSHRERTLEVFSEEILNQVSNPEDVYFIDFPFQSALRSVDWNSKEMADVVEYLGTQRNLDRERHSQFVPMLLDHDFGSPFEDKTSELTLHAISEFVGLQPTLIHHGSEESGRLVSGRQKIDGISKQSDTGALLKVVGEHRAQIDSYYGGELEVVTVNSEVLVLKREGRRGSLYLLISMGEGRSELILDPHSGSGRNLEVVDDYFSSGQSTLDFNEDGRVQFILPSKGYILMTTVNRP